MKATLDAAIAVDPSTRRLVVGIGECAVSNRPGDLLVTHGLGSCIAVCVFDPQTTVAGLLHFLLPEARINPERARVQPAVFADTGIPLLLSVAAQHGLVRQRAIVKLVGGAEMAVSPEVTFNTGRRNVLAARNLLWRSGVFVAGQEVGGTAARTLHLSVATGRLLVFNQHACKEL
ncbi:MAG TPA: chemotaxis protein CheD [Vicinamibacterales bacterium]|nr:chemotaxis protein CheD [Vicinamibacterales bacterium]